MLSILEIYNQALARVQADRLASETDDIKTRHYCDAFYNSSRLALLQSHAWNFALTRKELVEDATTPLYGYSYRYLLPNDCIRVVGIEGTSLNKWAREGRYLFCNIDTAINIQYISDVTETGYFSPLFTLALVLKIAVNLALSYREDKKLAADLQRELQNEIDRAKMYNEIEGNRSDEMNPVDESSWVKEHQ